MLQNAYFLAKIGADTAENEQHFAIFCRNFANRRSLTSPPRSCRASGHEGRVRETGCEVLLLGRLAVRDAEPQAQFTRFTAKNAFSKNAFFENFANFWRARSRLYQNEILQENMRLTAFCKLYVICILLHRCNLKVPAQN